MATNMAPALYAAPQGLGSLDDGMGEGIEIVVDNPDAVQISFDGVTIDLDPDAVTEQSFDANLAESMKESELTKIATELLEDIEADIDSRKDWTDAYVKGLEVLACGTRSVRSLGTGHVVCTPPC